jgi:NADPH-dependent ferric siderophore reductase
MSDAPRPPAPAGQALDDPFARLEGPLAGAVRMRLEVVDNQPLTPAMQQIVLTAPELATFSHRPGQDVMLLVAVNGNRPVRRRYTIAGLDAARALLTLGIVRHEGGPGEAWVAAARPGDVVEGIGPRGKIFPAEGARAHLFIGDHAALPAFFAMARSLPAGERARLVLEVPGPADEQPLSTGAAQDGVTWLHRDGRPAGDPGVLARAAASVPLPRLDTLHAYLAGEARAVLAMREALAARGVQGGRVSAKAYWGRGKPNAAHGEPEKDSA